MKPHIYLNFNGTAEEAFNFYAQAFNTTIKSIYRFGDMPSDPNHPIKEEDKNKVMHMHLSLNDNIDLMASDCLESYGQKAEYGNAVYIMLDTQSKEEAKALYQKLTIDAQQIEMELGEQFWAELYGSFIDKYGVRWMIHHEGNKANNF
jgi:PhnB protein